MSFYQLVSYSQLVSDSLLTIARSIDMTSVIGDWFRKFIGDLERFRARLIIWDNATPANARVPTPRIAPIVIPAIAAPDRPNQVCTKKKNNQKNYWVKIQLQTLSTKLSMVEKEDDNSHGLYQHFLTLDKSGEFE